MPLTGRAAGSVRLVAVACTCLCAGCGAKSGLSDDPVDAGADSGPPCATECDGSSFCRPLCLVGTACVPGDPPDCDDRDPCTEDRCDLEGDRCANEVTLVDEDLDGYQAPIDCGGSDCDDADPTVNPGAAELCNGRDEDCDGLIDEGAQLVPSGGVATVAASDETDALGSAAWTGDEYVVGFWDYRDGDADVSLVLLDVAGEPVSDPVQITTSAADGFGPSLAWTGSELGAAWQDRRDGNFEIYFARFDRELRRLSGDIRVTDTADWSIYPRLAWSGREYLVVWQDAVEGYFGVYAQRIGPDGPVATPIGLSPAGDAIEGESPVVAFDGASYHVAWLEGGLEGGYGVRHALVAQDLSGFVAQWLVEPGEDAGAPTIAGSPRGAAIAWEEPTTAAGRSVAVALVSGSGEIEAGPTTLATGLATDREPALLWVNSGYLIAWSGLVGASFDLFYALLGEDGALVFPPVSLFAATGDSIGPTLALGPGEVLVAWGDSRSGTYDVLATRLLCVGL